MLELSPWQTRILLSKLEGRTIKEIAKECKGTEQSIKNQLGFAYMKLGVPLSNKDLRDEKAEKIRKYFQKYLSTRTLGAELEARAKSLNLK